MRVSGERQARTLAAGDHYSARSRSSELTRTHELAAGLSCGAVLGAVYGGAGFGWQAALGGASFGAFAALVLVGTFWSLRACLNRGVVPQSDSSIHPKKPLFTGVNRSAIVSVKYDSAISLPAALALWTASGAILGAMAGAGIAALVDSPDVARGAIRMAPACAALGFLIRLAGRPIGHSAN